MRAPSIDVLARPVYVWRLRDEGDSITQRLLEPNNIGDRFEMIDEVDELIRVNGIGDVVADRLRLKILEGDLWIYVREMSGAGEQTVDLIQRIVQRYWPRASEHAIAHIPSDRRVCYWLLERGRAADVALFRHWFDDVRAAPPLEYRDGRILLDVAECPVALDGLSAVHRRHGVGRREHRKRHGGQMDGPDHADHHWLRVYEVRFDGRSGHRPDRDEHQSACAQSIAFPVRRTASPDAARWAADVASAHDRDGFVCEIDARALRASAMSSASQMVVRRAGDRRRGRADHRPHQDLARRVGRCCRIRRAIGINTLAIVKTDKGRPLRLQFDSTGVFTIRFAVVGARVTLALADTTGRSRASRWRATAARASSMPAVTGGRHSAWTCPSLRTRTRSSHWRFYALIDGKRVPLLAPPGFRSGAAPSADGVRALVNRTGRAVLQCYRNAAFVETVDCTPAGDIQLSGSLYALDTVEIGLAPGAGAPDKWYAADVREGRFEVVIPTTPGRLRRCSTSRTVGRLPALRATPGRAGRCATARQ